MKIIAGKHKGRVLDSFKNDNTRPTSAMAREGIFSKLQKVIPNAVVVDLFSGTGALGFEALSRGCKTAILVEKDRSTSKMIRSNNVKMQESAVILNYDFKDGLKWVRSKKMKPDVIFLDPPYVSKFAEQSIKYIEEHELLAKNGIIVFEHDLNKNFEHTLKNLIVLDVKKYGKTKVSYLVWNTYGEDNEN